MSILIIIIMLSMTAPATKADIYVYKAQTETAVEESVEITTVEAPKDIDEGNLVNAEIIGETYIGNFKATAYCGCTSCCGSYASVPAIGAAGEILTEGYSIAADTSVLPLGSEVYINGHKYKVQDTGGAIRGNKIDIYFDSHSDALAFGVQYVDVYR